MAGKAQHTDAEAAGEHEEHADGSQRATPENHRIHTFGSAMQVKVLHEA